MRRLLEINRKFWMSPVQHESLIQSDKCTNHGMFEMASTCHQQQKDLDYQMKKKDYKAIALLPPH